MKNPFEILKQAQMYLGLAAELQSIDADQNKRPDYQDYLLLAAELSAEGAKLQGTVAKIQALFGADVLEIKKRFGL